MRDKKRPNISTEYNILPDIQAEITVKRRELSEMVRSGSINHLNINVIDSYIESMRALGESMLKKKRVKNLEQLQTDTALLSVQLERKQIQLDMVQAELARLEIKFKV